MSEAAESIEQALQVLETLDRRQLAQRWVEAFGSPAPRKCQAMLLRTALAWQIQMEQSVSASTPPKARNSGMKAIARQTRRMIASPPARSLSAGSRLLREWQGRTHQVTVLAKGFEYEGKPYRSLTAIATTITGTPWSGPAFFGLRK